MQVHFDSGEVKVHRSIQNSVCYNLLMAVFNNMCISLNTNTINEAYASQYSQLVLKWKLQLLPLLVMFLYQRKIKCFLKYLCPNPSY